MRRRRPSTVSSTLEPAEMRKMAERVLRRVQDHTKRVVESRKAKKCPHVTVLGVREGNKRGLLPRSTTININKTQRILRK
jgi:D-serine deaminase-like pyridoxal phosphate-dependent protein